ncbi:CHASE3 domain-containing protein [Paradesertivirga mongoliensis]|uniref:histidine kinase n=1 Tax=Paradesertivirga mongoliensis TaxID=2100740 RepID=A0ABW4ZMU2_9SPHI|nr:CHASE3 domain-containing protein [Pedobacter mongoliensis]
MKGSFIKNLHKAFLYTIILLAVMAAISFMAIRESNHRAEMIHHTEVVLDELEYFISQLKDAETGVRGYIITSDSRTLDPYNGAYKRTIDSYQKLKLLTGDNPRQQQTLNLLRNIVEQRFKLLSSQINLIKNNQNVPAERIFEGKQVMDQARALITKMQLREKALLEIRTSKWETFRMLTPFLILCITLISAAVSYYFCAQLKKTYYKKAKLQQLIQRESIEKERRIAIIERVADKIAAGDYHIRLQEEDSDLLGSLAISLNRMAISLEYSFNEIKALMAKKDDFIGIAAHELKTPLTSIKAYLQFIGRAKLENNDANKIYPFITKANNQVNRLTEIIKDLLDVARINENQLGLKLDNFSMRMAVLEASEEIFNSIKTHQLFLEGDPDIVVQADKFRIEQVLINLISNAIKYSPNSDRIIVDIKPEQDLVKVSVTDFGIGIPKDNLQYIFQRYFRVEVTSQNYSGMGLGLYISKGIIKRHGGDMGVNSREGEGSTFWFTLPLKHPGA